MDAMNRAEDDLFPDAFAPERDWFGLLAGIGLAIGWVFLVTLAIHLYLRWG